MKFTIDKVDLDRALSSLNPFLDKRGDSLTSNFFLTVKDSSLTIKATNLKIGLSVRIDSILVEAEGKVLVDGVRLLQVFKPLKRANVTLELFENELIVKQGKSKLRVKTHSNTDGFYKFPTITDMSRLPFNGELLRDGFDNIIPSIDGNSPKYELTGGLISILDNKINFVSTDTKRLTVVEEDLSQDATDLELIIPRPAIIEIPKLFDKDIEFIYNEEFVIIESKDKFFFTKLVSGKYPNWQRIVPTTLKYTLKFQKNEMMDNLKLVSSVTSEVKISLDKNGISFETLDYKNINSKAETSIDINLEIPESFEFGANSRFIIDFLNCVDEDSFELGFNEVNRPFVLQSKNLRTVIMPINIGDL